jgi:hypothetical protein
MVNLVKIEPTPEKNIKGVLCLGEYGRIMDLTDKKALADIVIDQFNSKSQAVRDSASIALGNIAAGNPDAYLRVIFSLIKEAPSA